MNDSSNEDKLRADIAKIQAETAYVANKTRILRGLMLLCGFAALVLVGKYIM